MFYFCGMVNETAYRSILHECEEHNATLVAVSKIQSIAAIRALYDLGHRDFGENYVQELLSKQEQLPKDIRWHFIGHLQSNKVKYLAPFIHLVQSVDSAKLLKEINKQAAKEERVIQVLLQVHIAEEATKFGLDENELDEIFSGSINDFKNVKVSGLMGMATFTDDMEQVKKEFSRLRRLFEKYREQQQLEILSMGMSGDYQLALEQGSNMVRIGSLLFGARNYQP